MFGFKGPTTIGISGCTGTGKTTFVISLLKHKNEMFVPPPEKVLYAYGIWQKAFTEIERELPFVEFYEGLPTMDIVKQFSDDSNHSLLILDDQMSDCVRSKDIEELFSKGSHHLGVTICYLTQNMFCAGKCARNTSLNTHFTHLVLFKNVRDINQIKVLANQTGMGKVLVDAFKDVHKTPPYSYLVVDLSPNANEKYKLRTNIFPNEECIIYVQ